LGLLVNSWTDRNSGRRVKEVVAVVEGDAFVSVDTGCVKCGRAEVMLIEKQWRGKGD
jgi:hypothetical protein